MARLEKSMGDESLGYEYDDGNWYAATLGHFIGLLVDAGQDPAVCFRITHDSVPDADGQFIRRVEVLVLPDGCVGEAILGCRGVHKLLKALLEAGIVK